MFSKEDTPITAARVIVTLAGTGILGVISAGMMAIANDARVAISVAEQHGQELLMLRGELNSIRNEMVERTAARYTTRDHEAYEKYVDRRFAEMESALKRLEK